MSDTPQLSKHRIEALIDGIFAVAMTLLVIDLHVPEHAHSMSEAMLRRALWELLPNFESWIISFLVLALFWLASHSLYAYVRHVDRRLIWCTMLMLAGASLVPCAAAINSQSGSEIGQAIYAGVLVWMSSSLLLTVRHIYRTPALCVHEMDVLTYRAACLRAMGGMTIAALTVPLAYVSPAIANTPYMLMFGLRPAAQYIARRWTAAVDAAGQPDEPVDEQTDDAVAGKTGEPATAKTDELAA